MSEKQLKVFEKIEDIFLRYFGVSLSLTYGNIDSSPPVKSSALIKKCLRDCFHVCTIQEKYPHNVIDKFDE